MNSVPSLFFFFSLRVLCSNTEFAEEMETSISSNSELSPEDERLAIRDLIMTAESQTKEGDAFYLITQRWWQHWRDYVNQDLASVANDESSLYGSECNDLASASTTTKPSAIDNLDLIYDVASEDSSMEMELHDTLVEGRDYVLLPEEVWKQLHIWYGGGPTLVRRVINTSTLAVEVHLLRLRLMMPKGEHAIVRISKKETVKALHERACEVFYFNVEQICIWDYYGGCKHTLLNELDKTLYDANLQMDQDILVEVIGDCNDTTGGSVQENGSAEKESASILVEPCKSSLSTGKGVSRSCSSEISQSQYLASPVREGDNSYGISSVGTRGTSGGLSGLLNLGNTCYMNSAIQCLVHTPEFARYFQDDYHPEINWQNPMGTVGELALAFGELLRKLWAPGRTTISPRPFKIKLTRFSPQFSGYNQHDSQELLAFLLDGLHEDLNRVKDKPYIESRDADGRADEEVADEYWANYLARNDSIIVDVCQGQYKSTLVCPACSKISVTFDPFMWLSLPLQPTNTRTMTVTVFASDGSALPRQCTVSVPTHGLCRDLIIAISSACSLKNSEKLLLAEIRNHLVVRLEDPLVLLSTIKDDSHLTAYKMPKSVKNMIYLELVHRREEKESNGANSSTIWKPYGVPLVLPISSDDITTRGDFQAIVRKILSPMQRTENMKCSNLPSTSISDAASHASQDVGSGETCTNVTTSDSTNKNQSNLKLGTVLKLPLRLVDENNACVDISVREDKAIKVPSSSTSVLVYIDWSQKLQEKYDTFYIENLPEVHKQGPPTKKARSEPLSLYTCLEAFLHEEPLKPDDMWYCPQCKENRQASKKLDLWRLPEVLVIHLKRFSYHNKVKTKLETYVNFPIHDFDLTKYVARKKGSQRHLYELYALSNHYGNMGHGHYTASIKVNRRTLGDENRWYNFDDSHVTPINEEDVKSPAAYVLFYRRKKSADASVNNGMHPSAVRSRGSALK